MSFMYHRAMDFFANSLNTTVISSASSRKLDNFETSRN